MKESSAEVIVCVNDDTEWNLKEKSKAYSNKVNRKRLIVDLIKNRSSQNKRLTSNWYRSSE